MMMSVVISLPVLLSITASASATFDLSLIFNYHIRGRLLGVNWYRLCGRQALILLYDGRLRFTLDILDFGSSGSGPILEQLLILLKVSDEALGLTVTTLLSLAAAKFPGHPLLLRTSSLIVHYNPATVNLPIVTPLESVYSN